MPDRYPTPREKLTWAIAIVLGMVALYAFGPSVFNAIGAVPS